MARIDSPETEGAKWIAGQGGSIAVDLSGGTPFWAFTPDWLFKHIAQNAPVPVVSVNAGGISWFYSAPPNGDHLTPMPGLLVFGVY
ncbi:hypothetical protein [Burkholderia pseudomallei]|uniref:hypothetical protein n=1 Tax=Burkholderia pseudomallei TaxID=28450 RepID=UPI0005D85ADD|nr:hypothetical protein [Burkholderia pseudomallei]AJX21531.1 putative gp61 [Burkholderia pseudomallei MSHR491]